MHDRSRTAETRSEGHTAAEEHERKVSSRAPRMSLGGAAPSFTTVSASSGHSLHLSSHFTKAVVDVPRFVRGAALCKAAPVMARGRTTLCGQSEDAQMR